MKRFTLLAFSTESASPSATLGPLLPDLDAAAKVAPGIYLLFTNRHAQLIERVLQQLRRTKVHHACVSYALRPDEVEPSLPIQCLLSEDENQKFRAWVAERP